jgi:hypothetical protein
VVCLKGEIMKRIASVVIVFLFIFSGIALAYDSGHIYRNGQVNSISSDIINVSGERYKIGKICKIVIQYKQNNAFHERHANFGDVHTGDIVTIKETGKIVTEIIIEEWRR